MKQYFQTTTLKEDVFFIEILKANLEISEVQSVDLTLFEKFIIKVIDKAYDENISLVDKLENDVEIQYQKIADILSLDEKIISNNLDNLQSLGVVKIANNKLSVIWNDNLRNWKKEIIKYSYETIYFEPKNGNEFLESTEQEKQIFLKSKFPEAKDIQLITNETQKIEFNIKAILENGNINIFFDKNKLETLTDYTITNFKKIDIKFQDDNLNSCISEYLQENNLNNILDIKKLDCSNRDIKNITGIEFLANLEELNISENRINNLLELLKCKNLIKLIINNKLTISNKKGIQEYIKGKQNEQNTTSKT